MNHLFVTPVVSYPLIWLFDWVYPSLAKLYFNLDDIEISEFDRERLKKLQRERVLYLSNHPSNIELPIAYYVANCMGSHLHFLVSHTVFEWLSKFGEKFIRRLGKFSIFSSKLNEDAIKSAKNILSENSGKLAIFPEGIKSNENDNLLPFQSEAIQIGFEALEEALKKDSNANIIVVTTFVKYVLTESKDKLLKHIDFSLQQIEKKLGLSSNGNDLLERFFNVGRIFLENAEKEYNLFPNNESFDFRIARVKHAALNRAADNIGIHFPEGLDTLSKMRELFEIVESYELGFPIPKYQNLKPKNFLQAKQDMEKAYTFIVIRPIYLKSRPTAERMVEWLARYETMLFGNSPLRAQKAILQFAPFFGLKEYFDDYKKDKKATVEMVTNKVKNYMEAMLIEAISFAQPIIDPIKTSQLQSKNV